MDYIIIAPRKLKGLPAYHRESERERERETDASIKASGDPQIAAAVAGVTLCSEDHARRKVDMAAGGGFHFPTPEQQATTLAHQLGQVSLDSSPVLSAKAPKFSRKYSLRELEIQQTLGELTVDYPFLVRLYRDRALLVHHKIIAVCDSMDA